MFDQADFNYYLVSRVLVIEDKNNWRKSVTNDIENVLQIIDAEQGWLRGDPVVIYKDAMGIWDGVRVKGRRFAGFYSLHETDISQAINKAKELAYGSRHSVSAHVA